jgi:hypothetical protein
MIVAKLTDSRRDLAAILDERGDWTSNKPAWTEILNELFGVAGISHFIAEESERGISPLYQQFVVAKRSLECDGEWIGSGPTHPAQV